MNKLCIGHKSLIAGLALASLGFSACSPPENRSDASSTGDQASTSTTVSSSVPTPISLSPGGAGEVGEMATIVRVVDGDTIKVRINNAQESVRLIGIDTPETVDPRKPVQCFGQEASAHTTSLLPVGTRVRLVADVEPRDRYKRMLRYVYRDSDGLFVNDALVRDGYARVYTYPPNVAHASDFVVAARDARENGRGLWSAC